MRARPFSSRHDDRTGVPWTPPNGFTEVAGIAVAAAQRRRGLATALTAELARRAFAAGVRAAYLTPADDEVARL